MMKFLFLFLTIISFCQLSFGDIVWNSKDKFNDWKRYRNCTTKVENGILTLSDIAFDCLIVNDSININPTLFNGISITYKAQDITTPSSGEVFFTHGSENFSEKRRWTIPSLIADGQWHTISIKPKNLNSWITGGNISSLRIDMVNKPGGKIAIKEIRLHEISQTNVWKNESLKKWKLFSNCDVKFTNGNLVVNVTKNDCRILATDVNINPKDANNLVIIYRATGTPKSLGELYFARDKENYSDARRWRIPALIADGQWHTLVLTDDAINNKKAWYNNGNITKLRLDPTNAAGGKIEIKEIRFAPKKKVKKTPKVTYKPLDEPYWPKVVSQLKNEVKKEAYFTAKMIKAPQDTLKGKMMRPFFVRRKLNLKATPAHAKLQFTADDYCQVVINGKEVAFSNSWRDIIVCDVTDFLKKGDNVLGFQYYNKDTYGGVFGELYVQYPDGSSQKISTDKYFKSLDKEVKNWATTLVDDSKWDTVIEQLGPPNAPWLIKLKYIDFKNLQKITQAKLSNKNLKWGDQFTVKLTSLGKCPDKEISFRVVLLSNEKVQFANTITIPKKDLKYLNQNSWSTAFNFKIPYFLPTGNYEILLESSQISTSPKLKKELSFTLSAKKDDNPKFAKAPNFKVVKINNYPRFQLNGKPFYMSLAKTHSYQGDKCETVSANAPFSAVNPSPNYEKWHVKMGIYDFTEFDRVIAKIFKEFPNTYIIFGIDLYVPPNFSHKYPDDMIVDENGTASKSYKYSIYSKSAANYLTQTAIKAIEYVENSPYANRIIGYRIAGGYTTEFLGWEPGLKLDYSKCAQMGFKEYAKKHYPQLKTFKIPTFKERTAVPAGTVLWNPMEHLSTVAYYESYSAINAKLVEQICTASKAYLAKRKIQKVVGTYFGYVATLNHTGVSQHRAHYALNNLLKSQSVDFLMSPNSYPLRNLGDIVGDMKPFASLNDYNVISFIEDDTRTHNGPDIMHTVPGSRSQVITEKQSLSVMRRNIGVALCRNQPENYNPMLVGSFDFESMRNDIAIRRVLGDFCAAQQLERDAQVAIVVSEKATTSMPVLLRLAKSGYAQQFYNGDGTVEVKDVSKTILTYETFIGNQSRFARTGAPVDIVLAEALDKAKPYKVYAFINAYNYDKKFLETVKKLQQKKCTLLWVYAPGFAYDNQASLEAMKQLTGFTFKQAKKHLMPALYLPNNICYGAPTVKVKPIFSVENKNAKVIGKYEDNSTGLASLKVGNSLSYFYGSWQLDLRFLSNVLKESGVHVFSNTGDPLEANESLVVLHARTPGKKTIKLKRKADILDIYENKIIAKNTNIFEFNAQLHETKVFFYGNSNDVNSLQKKLKNAKK